MKFKKGGLPDKVLLSGSLCDWEYKCFISNQCKTNKKEQGRNRSISKKGLIIDVFETKPYAAYYIDPVKCEYVGHACTTKLNNIKYTSTPLLIYSHLFEDKNKFSFSFNPS